MPKINKNTDLTEIKKYFIGKGEIEITFLPPFPFEVPKTVHDLPYHWKKLDPAHSFNAECNPMGVCPICEMLKPKTRWQKLKIRISKLWKRWTH